MAATIQTPAQQPPPTANNNNNTSPATPQLKRIVYSKYRELLGSYNDKANAIIESLPAYMVKEDRGFHFDPQIIDDVDKVVYGTPPAPPPLSTGAVPTQRLPTQMPQHEAPACVQNAMMTKDKKPFTYTPGGIDLSQIKSQRMAKRLARNAQSEGATGQQQMHRPTPPPQQSNGGASPASHLGATAMGMPFQVLPTGPPPPPPQPGKAGQPPPPPPVPQSKLAPQSNGNAAHARKSPTPQNFEPPPIGFRPEIKIPPNPMAALKKVPPPQEKNNFWVEEYRKERSKSPLVGNDENDYTRSPPNKPQPETNQYTYSNFNNNSQQNEYQPQLAQQNRSPSPQPMRPQQEYTTQRAVSPARAPAQQRLNESPYQTQYSPQPQQQQSPSIQRPTSQYQYQSPQSSPQQQQQQPQPQYQPQSPPAQRQQIASPQKYQCPTPPQYQQQQQQQQTSPSQQPQTPQQQQSVPWRSQRQVASGIQNNVSGPREVMSPAPNETPRPQPQQQQQEQQQQYPAYLRSRDVRSPAPELQPAQISQPYQQKNSQVGSIYIPPVGTQQQQSPSPYQEPQGARQQQQASRQVPANRWATAQPPSAEQQSLNRIKSPPPPSSNGFGTTNNTGLRLQINNATSNPNVKERIIPIQLEQTPTPTRTPSAPGFGPQPFYNANQQQYSSVPSPSMAQGGTSNGPNSPSYIVRSPNQFVDQGYNNYPGSQDPNRVTSPTAQQIQSPRIVQQTNTTSGVRTRIIPIALESPPDGPLNPNNVRGPISQQPLVIQNDPRNQNTWGSGSATPNQSKSFRILQHITDTTDEGNTESKSVESNVGDQEPQLQRPTYARQMGPGQMNSPTIEQMKRMQLNNDQAFANRARNQENNDDKERVDKKSSEDPRYRGPSNPSKTFQKLQSAIERCPPTSTADKDGASPVMKQPQPNRYVNQRPVYSPDEQSQQYVHPSEQQIPEPKKYTGSAIPSRSFKILQAMTTPENAAEMECSDVVVSNKSITECPCQHPPPPPPPCMCSRPYLPPCCTPPPLPPSSSGGDVHNNWQYPSPHHHPHHPCSPCPYYYYYYPPSEYDSQNCSPYHFVRGNSQTPDLPNIIITPSAEEVPQVARDISRDQREGSVIETLSRRLNEITKPVDFDLNMSQEDDKKYVGDGGKKFGNSPSPIKSECENYKVSQDDSSDDLLTSSSDPTTTSSFEDCGEHYTHDGLQAIKSVTNIQVYNKRAVSPMEGYEDDLTVADGESIVFDEECEEEEEEEIVEDLEYDEEVVLIEEADSVDGSEIEEIEEEDEEEEEVIVMDDLSVIYEENEADIFSPRPRSRISSSVSDTTTLANVECEEEDLLKENEDDDDNSNSVTVRLPLKFSFSRSSNDENIATVEVGNSQIEDKRRSFSIASVIDPDDYESDHECDVSVTISLSPSGGSFDRKSSLSPVPRRFEPFRIVQEEVKLQDSFDFEAEDVSVSFSLPVTNKSFNQTPTGDTTETVAIKKKKKKKSLENENSAIEAWRKSNSEVLSKDNNDIWSLEAQENHESTGDYKSLHISNRITKESSPKKEEQAEDGEEVDFWATLQATRKEAQLFLEKTADYWGKKIDGREKSDVQAEQDIASTHEPKDSQTEEDFWATIRVKDDVESVKESEDTKKKSTTKSGKPKKKKKVVKAPEKEPEPEHVWSTIKLPNANNRSKIVESTIKMIQDKAKPKEVAKPVRNEVEVGDLVASITGAYDKDKKEESIVKESSSKIKIQKSVSLDSPAEPVSVVKLEKEDIRAKLVKEKAEFKTQIMNQKFAKAFVIPDKPIAMRGVLSETEPLKSISKAMEPLKVEPKLSTSKSSEILKMSTIMSEEKTVTDETEKVEKPKKRVSKSKKETVEYDSDILKAPKVKKSSTDPKKIKKKKQDIQVCEDVSRETTTVVTKETLEPKIYEPIKEENSPAIEDEAEETDFWAQIESSRSNGKTIEDTSKGHCAEDKIVWEPSTSIKNSSDDNEETDFWSVIESSKAENGSKSSEPSASEDLWGKSNNFVETRREVNAEAEVIDIWADVQSIETKKSHKKTADKKTASLSNATDQSEEIDIWAEIESAKAKKEHIKSFEKEASLSLNKTDNLQPAEVDFWADIESMSSKTNPILIANDTIVSKEEQSMVDQSTDFRSEKKNSGEEDSVTEETCVWSKPFQPKYRPLETTDVQADFSFKVNIVEPAVSDKDLDQRESTKLKTKKKSKKILPEVDVEIEAETLKPKTKKKSSKHQEESTDIYSETLVETVQHKKKNYAHEEQSTEVDIGNEVELDGSISRKKPSKLELQSALTDFNFLETLKPRKKNHALEETSTDYAIGYEAELVKTKSKKKSSKLDEDSIKIDPYSVEILKPKKKKHVIEEQPMETEIGYEMELVKTKSKTKSPKLQGDSMEIESYAAEAIKPKKKKHGKEEQSNETETAYEVELVKPKSKKKSSKRSEDSVEMNSNSAEIATLKKKKHILKELSTETEIGYEVELVKPKSKKKSSKHLEESTEVDSNSVETMSPRKIKHEPEEQLIGADIGHQIELVKSKSKKKIATKLQEDSTEIESNLVEIHKTKKKSAAIEELLAKYNIGKNVGSVESKSKKKSSSKDEPTETTDTVKSKSKKKNSQAKKEDSETPDFWAEIEVSKTKTSKKSKKSSSLHVYGDYDVELINVQPVPTFYAVYTTPSEEMSLWATISYAEEPIPKVMKEKETDFWASNSSGNETEVNSEVDTGKIDFWVTQRKFETNSGLVKEASPKNEEESEEVDFWAEIQGPDEDVDELHTVVLKDECEARRNNYKKAMAFFTNTVKVDKKEATPGPSRNIETPKIYNEKTPEAQPYSPWGWREPVEYDWEAPVECEVNDVLLIVDDNETEDEPDTLIENNPYGNEETCDFDAIEEEQCEEEEEVRSESSESITDSTPNHFQIERPFPKLNTEFIKPKEKSIELISNKISEEIKISVKDRIFAFETGTIETPAAKPKPSLIVDSATPKSNLSRNSSQRSESEIEEDDSGVTDMNKPLSETDTESESFPELRKMTRYQRASTHSRLFKLLQDDCDLIEEEPQAEEKASEPEHKFHSRKKIVHNVSITRKQNPKALQDAESMSQRRERLSLPLRKNTSIDADNLSSPNSPASPIFGQPSQAISDKLVNELVQSLLLKNSSSNLKNLPMEKLQAAAKRVLEEELDSLENTSLDSTPALTPQEFKSESYSDYYDTWNAKNSDSDLPANGSFEILPSKAFKALQESTATAKRRPWAVRCPRVLSSKTVNRDLARVTESPEIFSRSSRSPEIVFGERASSVGRWRKV